MPAEVEKQDAVLTSPWTEKQAAEAIREVLEKWPLYRELQYSGASKMAAPPEVLFLHCEKCASERPWDTSIYPSDYRVGSRWQKYTCRTCRESETIFYFYWTYKDSRGRFLKVGQYPAFAQALDPEYAKALGPRSTEFYKKALFARNSGLGIASVMYLRLVLEDRIHSILDFLAESARHSAFAADSLKDFDNVKWEKAFEEKVTYAAKILPPHLRLGEINPIDVLQELALPRFGKSEAESNDVYDRCDLIFQYFWKVAVHRENSKIYAQALHRLNTRFQSGDSAR